MRRQSQGAPRPAGKSFYVDVVPLTLRTDAGGFYGVPTDDGSPFREVFFFSHGVNRLESREPIGELLLVDGVVEPDDLARGIAAQQMPLGKILVQQERVAPEAVEAAASIQERRRLRLGEVLIEAGLATAVDIEAALAEQRKRKGKKIGEILIEMGVVREHDLMAALGRKFHIPYVDLDILDIQPAAAAEVPRALIERYGFLPVSSDDHAFTVAIGDPLDTEITDILRFHLKRKRLHEVLAAPSQLKRFVERLLREVETNLMAGSIGGADIDSVLRGMAANDLRVAPDEPEHDPVADSGGEEQAGRPSQAYAGPAPVSSPSPPFVQVMPLLFERLLL